MAGVGMQIRQILAKDSYASLVSAYGYAGLISCGPWVFSIAGVFAVGVFAPGDVISAERVTQFLVSITWSTAVSLIITGPLQLLFGRFVADRIFEERRQAILPNLFGALLLVGTAGGVLAAAVVFTAFDESLICSALLVANFVILCLSWVLLVLLSGVKAYRAVSAVFLGAQLLSVGGALALRDHGLEGLLTGFVLGQASSLFGMLVLVLGTFPGEQRLRFDFLMPGVARYELAVVGLVFYIGIWADKAIFWLNPSTSTPVLGPLRASILYDLPIFLAYLMAIPAVTVFFLRLEADFAPRCEAFLAAARGGAPLSRLHRMQEGMVLCVRRGLLEIVAMQGLALVVVFALGPEILRLAGISPAYLRLLHVDVAAVGFQVLFLAVLNILFYLDERRAALALALLFASGNLTLTLLSQQLGPNAYGFGFAAAALIAVVAGMPVLSRKLDRLDRDTFMRQPLFSHLTIDQANNRRKKS
jgi:polysaccharide biosynthesis protein PelG